MITPWQRLKNLYKLSEFHPNPRLSEGQEHLATLIKTPTRYMPGPARFIAFEPVSPVQKIVDDTDHA